jgi:predicted  nucleic acid-binding Zn-ribbon protein
MRTPCALESHIIGGTWPPAIRMKTEEIIDALLQLAEVENALAISQSGPDEFVRERRLGRLRREIPEPHLVRYQRSRAQGQRPVAPVVSGVCTGRFLRLPTDLVQELRSGQELLTCPNCAALIYDAVRSVEAEQFRETRPQPIAGLAAS